MHVTKACGGGSGSNWWWCVLGLPCPLSPGLEVRLGGSQGENQWPSGLETSHAMGVFSGLKLTPFARSAVGLWDAVGEALHSAESQQPLHFLLTLGNFPFQSALLPRLTLRDR